MEQGVKNVVKYLPALSFPSLNIKITNTKLQPSIDYIYTYLYKYDTKIKIFNIQFILLNFCQYYY